MPTFIWTVKDKAGQPAVREITAATAEESRSVLLAEGCSELALVHDEIADAATAGMRKSVEVGGEKIMSVSAEDRVRAQNKPSATYFSALQEGIWESKWFVLA